MIRTLTPAEAGRFWAHPTQNAGGILDPGNMPDFAEYWALGPVCAAFHTAAWPGVAEVHVGVLPEAWGHAAGKFARIVAAYAEANNLQAVIGKIEPGNRAAIVFAKRAGFREMGICRAFALMCKEF